MSDRKCYRTFTKAAPIKGEWTPEELKVHLQQAVTLELTTIPLYLFALFSLKDPTTTAYSLIKQIVLEEMLHLGLAGNVLVAVGGSPVLSGEAFVPVYPASIFKQGVMLNLRSAKNNMETFTRIEQPEFTAVPDTGDSGQLDQYDTIGAFYTAVENALKSDAPSFMPDTARQLSSDVWFGRGQMIQVSDLNSAMAALTTIVEQGEGTTGHLQGSHYELFKSLEPTIGSIDCYPVVENPTTQSYKGEQFYEVSLSFDAAYCFLLKTIEVMWDVSDPTERGNLTGNLFSMMGSVLTPLAQFLVVIPLLDGRTAAPAFDYFDLGMDPLASLKAAIQSAVAKYPAGSPEAQKLTAVSTTITGLSPIPVPNH